VIPEPYPLINAHWKTERAKFHLEVLKEEVRAFGEDSHTITIKDEPELDQVRYCISLKQPHVYLFLILGDFLQCLRTALDQAVWSLIYHRTGRDSDSSEFPVFAEPLNANDRKRFNRKSDGLAVRAVAYIESIQPYNRPAGTPASVSLLWRIHELNRIDKHRRISVKPQFSFVSRRSFQAGLPRADFAGMIPEATDYGYDVVCTGSYKHFKPQVTSLILFGEEESGIDMNIADLTQLYNFVTDEVLPTLAGFAEK
jgi:hypothetical protein